MAFLEPSQEPTSGYKSDGSGYRFTVISEVINDRYLIVRKLGWGRHSTVWLAWSLFEKRGKSRFVTLKFYKVDETAFAEKEIQIHHILKSIDSPHLVKYIEDFYVTDTYRNNTKVTYRCLVTEMAGVNLKQLTFAFGKVKFSWMRTITKSTVRALHALHNAFIMHCNMKPEKMYVSKAENVLCQESVELLKMHSVKCSLPAHLIANALPEQYGNRERSLHVENIYEVIAAIQEYSATVQAYQPTIVRVGGFGHASMLFKLGAPVVSRNPLYRSPEIILKSGLQFYTSDVYALACAIVYCTAGVHLYSPYPSESLTSDQEHVAQMIERNGDFPVVNFVNISGPQVLVDVFNPPFFERIQAGKSSRSRSVIVVLQKNTSATLKQCEDLGGLLKLMLLHDPHERYSTAECLEHPWIKSDNFPAIVVPSVLGHKAVLPNPLDTYLRQSGTNSLLLANTLPVPTPPVPSIFPPLLPPTTTVNANLPGLAGVRGLQLPIAHQGLQLLIAQPTQIASKIVASLPNVPIQAPLLNGPLFVNNEQSVVPVAYQIANPNVASTSGTHNNEQNDQGNNRNVNYRHVNSLF